MLISINKFFKVIFENKYQKALKYKYKLIKKYCENIDIEYLKKICNDKNYHIYLYTIDTINTISLENYKNKIIGIIIYRIILNTNSKIRIYISLLTIHKSMRKYGYGKILVDEIVTKYNTKIVEVVLLSLKTSYNFYNSLGFEQSNIKFIKKNEIIDDCIMMKKIYY